MSTSGDESQETSQSNEDDASLWPNPSEDTQGHTAGNDDFVALATYETLEDPLASESSEPTLNVDKKKRYLNAMIDVRKGMSIRAAAKKHCISYSALSVRVKDKSQVNPHALAQRKQRFSDAIKDVCEGMTVRAAAKKHGVSCSALSVQVKNKCELNPHEQIKKRYLNALKDVYEGMEVRAAAKKYSIPHSALSVQLKNISGPNPRVLKRRRYLDALQDVSDGMSIRAAAKKHNISYSALAVHVKNESQPPDKTGRQPFLSEEDETTLVEWCLKMLKIGCHIPKTKLPLVVQAFLKSKGKIVFPPDNLPTVGWAYKFLQRHPGLSSRLPQHIGNLKGKSSSDEIEVFLRDIKEYLASQDIDVSDLFNKENASRIFHCDVSNFFISANENSSEVFVKRGTKTPYSLGGESELLITALFCTSASGSVSKPLLVNKGTTPTVYESHKGLNPNSYNVACSDDGGMTGDVFYSWLANIFHCELMEMNIQRPIVLFLDGYSCHVFVDALHFARDNGIIIYCIPSLVSHFLQPLDATVCEFLQASYGFVFNQYTKQDHPEKHFPFILMKALERSNVSENSVRGFRSCGLIPFDPSAIKKETALEIINETNASPGLQPEKGSAPQLPSEPQAHALKGAYKAGFMAARNQILQKFEALLPTDLLEVFKRQFENGEDGEQNDVLYNPWREVKVMQEPRETPYDNESDPGPALPPPALTSSTLLTTASTQATPREGKHSKDDTKMEVKDERKAKRKGSKETPGDFLEVCLGNIDNINEGNPQTLGNGYGLSNDT